MGSKSLIAIGLGAWLLAGCALKETPIRRNPSPSSEASLLSEDERVFAPWLGKPLPDFALKDLQGQPHRLSDYRGKVVLLNFWATWCPPCMMEAPDLIALYQEHKDKGFVVLGISTDTPEAQRRFAQTYKAPYPLLLVTSESDLAEPYLLVDSIPTSFLVRPDGTLAKVKVGYRPKEEWEALLQELTEGS